MPIDEVTLNTVLDQRLHPGLQVSYVLVNGATITLWFDEHRTIRHYRSTDWDNAGWSVVQEVASQEGLYFDR